MTQCRQCHGNLSVNEIRSDVAYLCAIRFKSAATVPLPYGVWRQRMLTSLHKIANVYSTRDQRIHFGISSLSFNSNPTAACTLHCALLRDKPTYFSPSVLELINGWSFSKSIVPSFTVRHFQRPTQNNHTLYI